MRTRGKRRGGFHGTKKQKKTKGQEAEGIFFPKRKIGKVLWSQKGGGGSL